MGEKPKTPISYFVWRQIVAAALSSLKMVGNTATATIIKTKTKPKCVSSGRETTKMKTAAFIVSLLASVSEHASGRWRCVCVWEWGCVAARQLLLAAKLIRFGKKYNKLSALTFKQTNITSQLQKKKQCQYFARI